MADVGSIAGGAAHTNPKCPECNQTVTMRIKVLVECAEWDFQYVDHCDLYEDLVHRMVHGVWKNLKVRFRVVYPLVAKASARIAYCSKSEQELNDEIYALRVQWCWERGGMRRKY